MTPEQIERLVQTSFKKVVPIAGTAAAADLFYGRLFEIAPEVRSMLSARPQRTEEKADDHAGHGGRQPASARHYPSGGPGAGQAPRRLWRRFSSLHAPVGAALLWSLEQGLGPDFTSPVKDGLDRDFYTALAGVMTAA